MQTTRTTSVLGWTFAVAAMALGGCIKESTTVGPETSSSSATVDHHEGHDHDHGHAHPSEGPHHGELVELGNEEYHAEIVLDEDAGTLTVYILDGSATKQVPIDSSEITINAKHDGQPRQFTLAASPDESDPSGQSSRFIANDQELVDLLHEAGADPRLVLAIAGKSYRGQISHDHDHDHDHLHK